MNKLDHTQRGLVNTEGTIAQLEKSIKTAKAGSTITGVPPPRPSISAPAPAPESVDSGSGSVNSDAERRASVNFSARDLAQLRKKKQDEVAGERAATRCARAVNLCHQQTIIYVLFGLVLPPRLKVRLSSKSWT